jgi:hypothetical protein
MHPEFYMTFEEAKEKLIFHSCYHPDFDKERWVKGFLGSLRPFKGKLYDFNFHDVMICIKSIASHLRESNCLDRQLIGAITDIIYYGKSWAVDENAMLRRNYLIKEREVAKMKLWLSCITQAYCRLLEGCEDEVAFQAYNEMWES